MIIPPEFEFSQTNLQDYTDCRQRFLLRYLKKVAWPALAVDSPHEYERHIQRGQRFHRLAQQHLLGLPPDRLTRMVEAYGDHDLETWWDNFTRAIPGLQEGESYVEMTLSMPIVPPGKPNAAAEEASSRLVAKYDLVMVTPGQKAVILDWKTSRRVPPRAWLSGRLQTRVYPYLLVEAGTQLNGGKPFLPSQVEMIYWFAGDPQQPMHFPYNQAQFEQDGRFLAGLAGEIQSLPETGFDLTPDKDRCRYCVYRSLCDRGVEAGDLEGFEAEPEFASSLDFDLDQIAEVKF